MKVFSRFQKQDVDGSLRKEKKARKLLNISKTHSDTDSRDKHESSDSSFSMSSILESKVNRNSDYTSESSEANNKKSGSKGSMDLDNYLPITRVHSVIVNDDFSNDSFYEIINKQVNKQNSLKEAAEREILDKNR